MGAALHILLLIAHAALAAATKAEPSIASTSALPEPSIACISVLPVKATSVTRWKRIEMRGGRRKVEERGRKPPPTTLPLLFHPRPPSHDPPATTTTRRESRVVQVVLTRPDGSLHGQSAWPRPPTPGAAASPLPPACHITWVSWFTLMSSGQLHRLWATPVHPCLPCTTNEGHQAEELASQ
ncbi:uncharacterized protein LOC135093144 isoform X2 [Scylla paramamosain]|uniref:uncharacterized protein LOC135093144 isoform X2 n=1 Tax=Scylla paramamosain TaxID=85552 RepID=UPI003082AFEB